MKRRFYLLKGAESVSDNPFSEESKFKIYGKIIKTVSLSSLFEEFQIIKKSPFYNWKEIVGIGLAENSYPLYFDKKGNRLITAVSHPSFQITMRFIEKKIINELKKNKGCENLKEIFYVSRPDLFKDRYHIDLIPKSKEEQKKLNSVIKEIKKIISEN